jgi:hypothetical protein
VRDACAAEGLTAPADAAGNGHDLVNDGARADSEREDR